MAITPGSGLAGGSRLVRRLDEYLYRYRDQKERTAKTWYLRNLTDGLPRTWSAGKGQPTSSLAFYSRCHDDLPIMMWSVFLQATQR